MDKKTIAFILNGAKTEIAVESNLLLVDMLRDRLGLTGTKIGCGEGDCGACTVLVDGKTVNSCLILARQVEGHEVLTVEGLGTYDKLHPLQAAFIDEGAVQCGFCTPGMLLSAKSLLDENSQPTRQQIAQHISGNLCRCTGYAKIINAIEKVAKSHER
ncbi:(2Fe-2S)-binding protein [Sporomusa termitida]|uniref:Carbon monoxide dehydrogenase small chain n=1 Tax=Sporomusa termitida TaxID=2377 RepID=A0A517DYQ9_9FIRM|nr:(2Fe-2S)-binding protein [Sporomusa termitida]QDR82495.1 Carbon monoxide dehydrogenase small chain [Sporomusa termitida]